jgi:hypothetical protein
MKRRQFTSSVATLAGLSALFGQSAFAALDLASKTGVSGQLNSRGRFEARLGRQFTSRGSADTKLRLDTIVDAFRGHEQEQFYVLFDTPTGQSLPEGIYFLETNGKIEFGLHLQPGETIDGRQKMIATVNLQTAA